MSGGNSKLWPKLEKALRKARLDPRAVVEAAKRGEAQFLEVDGAVAITALSSSGAYFQCDVLAVAGDLSTMPALSAKVEAFARSNGCQTIETTGRLGWARVMPPTPGYKVIGTRYRKVLE